MKQRMISLLTAAALLFSLSACSDPEPTEATEASLTEATEAFSVEANASYSGTVTAISTTSITISTESGEVTIQLTDATTFTREFTMGNQMPDAMNQIPGEIPGSMGQGFAGMGEIPEGMEQGFADMGQIPEGMEPGSADMGQIPEGMEPGSADMGQAPTGAEEPPAGMDTETPSDQPDAESPDAADQTERMPSPMEGENGMDSITAIDPMDIQGMTGTIADVFIGASVTITTDDDGNAATVTVSGSSMDGMQQFGSLGQITGAMSSGVSGYDAATEFTADSTESGTEYASTAADENALHVFEGASVTLSNSTITRISGDSTGGDDSSFYGIGAAALVTDGTLTIADSSIRTDAAGGAGLFAYGSGTAYIMDTVIDTTQDTSGGIHVAGGGTLYAWDLTVETDGESSAAIRSDRGSGTMVVDGGSYTSNGVGSPAIYSAADITANNASLTSTGSEAICIEGLNSIRLFGCDLSGNMADLSQNDCTWNVILYQSMSGDSEIGNSTFEMVGGSLTAGNGGMFYTTNTESTFILSGVEITYPEDSEFFLKCTGNANQRGWGTTGKNGANCSFTAIDQTMDGDIIWDSISQLDLYILQGSSLTGSCINDESCAGAGGTGYAAIYIDSSSTWTVTGDSTLTSLHCAGRIVDENGAAVTVLGTDGTVYVQGDSQYTVTVEAYDSTADVSAASTVDSWSDFAVAKP